MSRQIIGLRTISELQQEGERDCPEAIEASRSSATYNKHLMPACHDDSICERAFSALGHVTVFGFGDGSFMLLASNGRRVHGTTLVSVLLTMLQLEGLQVPLLEYPMISGNEQAA
ncbi:hypothetical protein [Paraburkholderia sp. C35]|uniref:hypothetical protein n=1 Tax=Paraburkholderia sp. C35 TaxID=2126993 RepID=UPI000D692417|nr:hypothetical protein [Paraburkholderia sp. C35]